MGYSKDMYERVCRLYDSGLSMNRIAAELKIGATTVARWLQEGAPHDKEVASPGGYNGIDKPVSGGITQEMIEAFRKDVHVGDRFIINTYKASSEEMGAGQKLGVSRPAVVVDPEHPKFCQMELRNGIKESVLWRDLMRCKKDRRQR